MTMMSIEELRARWSETQNYAHSVEELQRAVRYNGLKSPCVIGCRSVCWKTFLLFRQEDSMSSWPQILNDARRTYAEQSDYLLRFIKHPESLSRLTVDPLADDPESPWNTIRQDEVVRAEIQQDVQRLPDEVNYHQPHIQNIILDILFVYCKLYPSRGGYRQGMHELLAPIVHVVEQDAVQRKVHPKPSPEEELMFTILDAEFIEHDAFVLFARIMDSAQVFYEFRDGPSTSTALAADSSIQDQRSAIVERSKFIHEDYLARVDGELASHITSMDILPQIFLIRWIRLLFSREFPFHQFLALWDTIFAVDPALDLIDLICVAMLIRIRWELLEADYSTCLQLLLKYPPPPEEFGPQTFVEDAAYLRTHMNPSAGSTLIMKYSGKLPASTPSIPGSRPETPSRFSALRQRGFGVRSPIGSTAKFLQPGGVEALLAKGAKGVLERGEKLGINQAVRDAVGEIRKNMQTVNDSNVTSKTPREILTDEGGMKAIAAMEARNKQLAAMLGDAVVNLKALSGSTFSGDVTKVLESIEVVAAKIQFVQIYLEDPTMDLPILHSPQSDEAPRIQSQVKSEVEPATESKVQPKEHVKSASPTANALPPKPQVLPTISNLEITVDGARANEEASSADMTVVLEDDPSPARRLESPNRSKVRPKPVPTRSTLAQSSFSWMLEPDESSPKQSTHATDKTLPSSSHSRRRGNASREKNAFLFGEVTGETSENKTPVQTDEIFGLETLQRG